MGRTKLGGLSLIMKSSRSVSVKFPRMTVTFGSTNTFYIRLFQMMMSDWFDASLVRRMIKSKSSTLIGLGLRPSLYGEKFFSTATRIMPKKCTWCLLLNLVISSYLPWPMAVDGGRGKGFLDSWFLLRAKLSRYSFLRCQPKIWKNGSSKNYSYPTENSS